ncbi:hypothetical protein [Methanocalculus sp.]|uniref:hypothetical protein n=1 Tax=Methanocalculus sp. TaxID=2004547 RepID=UPI00261DEAC6|nr:hypothetical protein [Methanocalculus sp.]MDG6250946.1 hypothetical protein [Methanocalculus sp.]
MDTIPLFRKAGCAAVLLICICLLPGTVSAGDLFSYQTTEQTYSLGVYTDIFMIEESSDGGFFIGGHAFQADGDQHAFVVKTDAAGEKVWSKNYPGEWTSSVKELEDGTIVFATSAFGASSGPGYLMMAGDDGSIIWQEELPGDSPTEIIVAGDEIILVGYSWAQASNPEAPEGFLYKYTLDGKRIHTVSYEGVSVHDIIAAPEGGYLIIGNTGSSGTTEPVQFGHLTKIDDTGTPEWSETYEGRSIFAITSMNGGYILVGGDMPYGYSVGTAWATGVTSDGTLLWETTLPGYAAYDIAPYGESFLIGGSTAPTSPYVVLIGDDGVIAESKRLPDNDGRFTAVLPISDDRVAVGGWSRHTGDVEGWFMIFDPHAEPVTPQPTLPVPVPTTGQPEPTKSPGFGILAAALGSTAAALLVYKRRRD